VKLGFQFLDFGADFQEAKPDGVELCGGEVGAGEGFLSEGMKEDRGRAVEHQPDEVRREAVT